MNLSSITNPGILLLAVAALAGCNQAPTGGTGASPAPATTTTQAVPTPAPAMNAAKFDPALPAMLQSPPAESAGECGIEATAEVPQGGTLAFTRNAIAKIEGWALVRGETGSAEGVFLKLASSGDASYFVPVTVGVREGLGIRLGDAALDGAAFNVDAAFQHVPAGDYTVQVAQRMNGRVLLCATGRNATVAE